MKDAMRHLAAAAAIGAWFGLGCWGFDEVYGFSSLKWMAIGAAGGLVHVLPLLYAAWRTDK